MCIWFFLGFGFLLQSQTFVWKVLKMSNFYNSRICIENYNGNGQSICCSNHFKFFCIYISWCWHSHVPNFDFNFFYLVGANFKIKMTTILYYKCLHPFSKFSSIAANVDTCIQYYFFECCLLTDIYDWQEDIRFRTCV